MTYRGIPEKSREKVEEFDRKLIDLLDEYGVEIGGCGCCGSPFLTSRPESNENFHIFHYSAHLKKVREES